MTIGSNSLQGLSNHSLSSEEINSLLSTFSNGRKYLIYPNFNQQDHFQQHDSTESVPPKLLLRRISCGECFQAISMKHIIQDSCQEGS